MFYYMLVFVLGYLPVLFSMSPPAVDVSEQRESPVDEPTETSKQHALIKQLLLARLSQRSVDVITETDPYAYNKDAILAVAYEEDKRKGLTPLHRAAKYGDVGKITGFLAAQELAEVEDRNAVTKDDGFCALHFAVMFGHAVVVRLLVDSNVSLMLTDSAGLLPLHHAARWGYEECAQILLEGFGEAKGKGGYVNQLDKKGWTPLMHAAFGGHEQVLMLLLQHGATALIKCAEGTAANLAQAQGHFNLVEILNSRRGRGPGSGNTSAAASPLSTPRRRVSEAPRCVSPELSTGIRASYDAIPIKSPQGGSLRGSAKQSPRSEDPSPRLSARSDNPQRASQRQISQPGLSSPAGIASPRKRLSVSLKGIEQDPQLIGSPRRKSGLFKPLTEGSPRSGSPRSPKEFSTFEKAVFQGLEVVQEIVEADVSKIREKDIRGRSLLHYALMRQKLDVVTYLLGKGASPDDPTSDGLTPLILAAQAHHYPSMIALINGGAKIKEDSEEVPGWIAHLPRPIEATFIQVLLLALISQKN